MLTLIITVRDDERALAATLRALVPGATQGLVREALVVDAGSTDGSRRVADAAGCDWLERTPEGGPADAERIARAPWLMRVAPGVIPEDGWEQAVAAHLERAEAAGSRWRAAVLPLAPLGGGLSGRLVAWRARLDLALFGRVGGLHPVIAPRDPERRLSGRPALLRARAYFEK